MSYTFKNVKIDGITYCNTIDADGNIVERRLIDRLDPNNPSHEAQVRALQNRKEREARLKEREARQQERQAPSPKPTAKKTAKKATKRAK